MLRLGRANLPSPQFWALLVCFAAIFVMGGSSRGDVQSLALLNPLMIVCCGGALLTLQREHLQGKGLYFVSYLVIFLLVMIYLPSLASEVGASSSGLATLVALSTAVDARSSYYSAADVSPTAWQSIYFLFVPMAVSLFAIQLPRDELRLTLPLIIGIGTISGILGVLQLAGNASGSLNFYNITNNGSAVGLFANRNHSAVFLACLFPLLALFAAQSRLANRNGRKATHLFAIAISILLVPLILVTGSRSGMLSAILGLVGGAILYITHAPSMSGLQTRRSFTPLLAISTLLCLVVATIYFSRAEAIDRIFADSGLINDRSKFWSSSLQLFGQYFPFGFGPGGFVPAFQSIEPPEMLDGAYLNRLHNDWLETELTFGVPGIFLMLAGTVYYVRRSFVLWMRMDGARSSVALGRMASIVLAIFAIASASDYPLRTPAMASFAALALVWFSHASVRPKSA